MLPENTNDRMLDHLATPVKIVPEENLQAVRVAHLANPAQTVGRVRLINLRAKKLYASRAIISHKTDLNVNHVTSERIKLVQQVQVANLAQTGGGVRLINLRAKKLYASRAIISHKADLNVNHVILESIKPVQVQAVNFAQTGGGVLLINLRAKCVRQASFKGKTIVKIVNPGRWHR